jgi:hypoxanthine phosphoribosyltransferase
VIQLHDKKFVPFISAEEIDFALAQMAEMIADDFAGETPVFIGILNGAFMVVSDLLKHYKGACEVSFVKVSSYEGMESTGDIRQLIGINQNLEGRSVIVVEDIVDTGHTVEALKQIFKRENVRHFKIATLFFKPEAYQKDLKLDYIGIRIPNKFIVGFGLDYDGLGRNLPSVYQVSE